MSCAPPDVDVVVVGAGLAGLGAATALRDIGRSALLLEASDRIGGRAWTAYPAELGGVWFDMGAVWLHSAERNPLVPIAQQAGDPLLRADELRRERTFIGTARGDAGGIRGFRRRLAAFREHGGPHPACTGPTRRWPRSPGPCPTTPGR